MDCIDEYYLVIFLIVLNGWILNGLMWMFVNDLL